MRSSRYCIGDGSPGAAARFRASSLVMASLSKKSLRAAERKRADVARARRRWIREQGWLDTTRLVFIDETAVTTNIVRLNGWSPCGAHRVGLPSREDLLAQSCRAHNRRTAPMCPIVHSNARSV